MLYCNILIMNNIIRKKIGKTFQNIKFYVTKYTSYCSSINEALQNLSTKCILFCPWVANKNIFNSQFFYLNKTHWQKTKASTSSTNYEKYKFKILIKILFLIIITFKHRTHVKLFSKTHFKINRVKVFSHFLEIYYFVS